MKTYRYLPLLAGLILSMMTVPDVTAQLSDTTGTVTGLRGAPPVYKLDPRTTAMGSAGVADAIGISSININPALLSFVRDLNTVQFHTYQNWENGRFMTNATLPALRIGQHRAAVQVGYHNQGPDVTTFINSGNLPEPSFEMYQLDVAYSYSFGNVLSLGMMQTVSFARNEFAQYLTGFASLGALYAPSESISYALVYRGLGRSTVYEILDNGRTTLGSQHLNDVLELGATLKFPVGTDETYLSVSLGNEKRFTQEGIWYKGGIEVKVIPALYLRSGILFNPDLDLYEPRYGIGVDLGRFVLDYSLSRRQRVLNRFHQLGLTIQL